MLGTRLNNENYSVSPLIGVVLIVAMTAALAAVFTFLTLDTTTQPDRPSPSVDLTHSDGYVHVSVADFDGLEKVEVINSDTGESVVLTDIGETKSLEAKDGDSIRFSTAESNGNEIIFGTATVLQSGSTRGEETMTASFGSSPSSSVDSSPSVGTIYQDFESGRGNWEKKNTTFSDAGFGRGLIIDSNSSARVAVPVTGTYTTCDLGCDRYITVSGLFKAKNASSSIGVDTNEDGLIMKVEIVNDNGDGTLDAQLRGDHTDGGTSPTFTIKEGKFYEIVVEQESADYSTSITVTLRQTDGTVIESYSMSSPTGGVGYNNEWDVSTDKDSKILIDNLAKNYD